jgi:NAD(P)-dependent dehydrogenase (short-subunit alcohol dehydrogenase family)
MLSQAAADSEVMPSFRLDGRLAVISGAGRGIGRACAQVLAAAGAKVMLLSRSVDQLEQTAQMIEDAGGAAIVQGCDLTDPEQIAAAIEAVPKLDVLVNVAGVNIPEPITQVSVAHLDAALAVNVRGTFLLAQAAAKRMLAGRGGGSIVNISSQMGHVGAANRTVYCATKHAVEGLTKAMAIELAPHGIRVNSVAPTFIETAFTEQFASDPEFRAEVEARIPLGRIGDVKDVTGAVLYLASDASSLVTGTSLLVDGGWTAQ